jgi:two-component system response regulator YesN
MYKLLVVDDEQDTRDTLCNCFPWDSVGFTIVAQLNNGMEALQFLQENEVDVLLCDIKMPAMTGIELSQHISNQKLAVKIVLLSAYRDFEYARLSIQYGVRHYMVKPAKYTDIVQVFTDLKTELDENRKNDSSAVEPVPMWDDPVVAAIISCIRDNYRVVSLQHIAELVNMNASYVSAYFKKKTGINFSEYLQKVRMEKAADLLRNHHMKAYEISEMVGYVNAKNFIRSFKQYFGKTPGQYKNEQSLK